MTMYILAGSEDMRHPEYAEAIARLVSMKVAQPKILSCLFSKPAEVADTRFPKLREFFLSFLPEGSEFMRAEPDTFVEQVRAADVVYFHGGHTSLLLTAMQQYPDIEKEFTGKIIIGSSAGANYLSSCGLSPRAGKVGLSGGILDVAVVVHYGSSGFAGMTFQPEFWDEAVETVRAAWGKGEVILLPEGMFTVIER